MPSKIKLKTVEDILYVADGQTERLLIKIRGRGWFMSSGGNTEKHLTVRRMVSWIKDDADSFNQVKVEHFNIAQKGGAR